MARHGWLWDDRDDADLMKGLVVGAIAGLAGAWMMNQYHALAARFQEDGDEDQGGREQGQEIGAAHEDDHAEPATEKAATAVVTGVFGHEMKKHEKQAAGSAAHFGFGASMGAAYGILAERVPIVRSGWGTAWGAGVWLAADEVAVPALGLAKPPQKHPLSVHMNALVAHLIFGITVESIRRVLRALWR